MGTQTKEIEMVYEITEYLNAKTGSSFRASSSSSRRSILARIHDGYTEEDFRAVIDEKARQWLENDTMERYLRPQTLFGSKFESYLQDARRHEPKPPHPTSKGFRSSKELLE